MPDPLIIVAATFAIVVIVLLSILDATRKNQKNGLATNEHEFTRIRRKPTRALT
jgi:hypothetical protein